MKKNLLFMALALCCAFAMTSCSSDDGDEKEPEDPGLTMTVTPVTTEQSLEYFQNCELYEVGDLYFKVERVNGKAETVEACAKALALRNPNACPENIVVPKTIVCGDEKLTVNRIGAFEFCQNLKTIELPNSIKTIKPAAFYECERLTSINLPNSIVEIGEQAFCMCNALASVKIPSSVTTIAEKTFWGCRNLTSVEIPNSVTTIGNWAFRMCDKLPSIEIPNSVTSIGESAFSSCSKLTEITSLSTTPPTLGANCFTYVPASCTLKVPAQAVEAYKAAEGWSAFQNIVGI